MRALWPEWDPTDELLREVWFCVYDKPDGLGAGCISHEDLHDAIVEVKRSKSWKEPDFYAIANAYRLRKNGRAIELEKQKNASKDARERSYIEHEHRRRMDRIRDWHPHRKDAAIRRARNLFPSIAIPESENGWSAFISGLVNACDEELRDAQ